MLGTLNDATILRLRVKGSDLDPLALRGRVENLLNNLSFQPRLPPSATLFIRKLKDPMPGLLELDTSFPRVPEPWRHAFNTRFDQLVASAARPALGPVADSVESVVFYDYAELLASLSADWCRGLVASRWWWQSFVRRGDISRIVKQLWREKIEYVPAALQQLVRRNVLVEFVTAISEDEVQQLLRRVVEVFAVQPLRKMIESKPRITTIKSADLLPETSVRIAAPWRHVAPEAESPRFSAVQQMFVGIGLMLQRAPARVRTVSFAREVEEWWQEISAPVVMRRAARIESSQTKPVPIEVETAEPVAVDDAAVVGEVLKLVVPVVTAVEEKAEHERERVKIGNVVFTHEEPVAVAPPPQPVITEPHVVEDHPIAALEPAAETFVVDETHSLAVAGIETQLGGLFYLINLGIFLEIYCDFTSPVETLTDLSIWDFVRLVGADILGEDNDEDDPIWPLLADLSDPDRSEDPIDPWLQNLLPYIHTRLRQALGIDDETDLAEILLRHTARVTITPTHLDVYFALAEHPIEIRLSGLDRNPGWVPAAGRFIAFHYD